MTPRRKLEQRLRAAIGQFWSTREAQAQKQGVATGAKDAGARAAVTGGAQMNGFISLVRDLLRDNGLPDAHVYCDKCIELPGWYRPEKKWDLLVVADGRLLASLEFKSQVGSFGNNYNNRTEEAIGSAVDLWTAYREGFSSPRCGRGSVTGCYLRKPRGPPLPCGRGSCIFRFFRNSRTPPTRGATRSCSRNSSANDFTMPPAF